MALKEEHTSVDLNTNYADVVVKVEKVTFGEKTRNKMHNTKLKRKQNGKISQAACALLNSGGGLVEAEIENECYSYTKDGLGQDIGQSLTELISSKKFENYFECMQQNNKLFIFVKSWSSEVLPSPRICSIRTGLYQRSGTSAERTNSGVAAEFLEMKKACDRRESDETKQRAETSVLPEHWSIHDSAEDIFNADHLTYGEKQNFTESTHVEFKEFSSKNILKHIEDNLPHYISAFANTQGGYLFIGVDDSRKVVGCSKENVKTNELCRVIEYVSKKLPISHICNSQAKLNVAHKILHVRDNDGNLRGYLCAVKIKPFCCAVFSDNPDSWIVKSDRIERLMTEDWTAMMVATDPEISNPVNVLKTELSVSCGSPLTKTVYSNPGITCLRDLQKSPFSVISNGITYTPENLTKELFSKYPGLENLMNEQMEELQASQGLLIFSRSWAVDIGLPENQQVVCDALLIAAGKHPMLYTVTQKDCSVNMFEYARQTARALKQKLVNVGGYTQRVCVIPHLLQLGTNEEGNTELDLQVKYPGSYNVSHKDMPKLLDSLVIILLGFRSFLSDSLGCEFFNLLTVKQYELLRTDFHKIKKQFIYGLPGNGKTTVALKIIEKIKNVSHCKSEDILYLCENQPLSEFVR
ncbi:ribonuclease SLFN12 [Caretta caretta]|uniref:ribonuclease SLFN12 n=1 Tax=Caretta caretta TaxID=8467 RepID=UPI003D4CEFAE